MALILNIETATPILSVALSRDGEVIGAKTHNTQNSHAEFITVFIEEIMTAAGVSYEELDAVAVSEGPGSYTGLRIGVSTAKGLCYAKNIPLIAVSTLQGMAWGMAQKHPDQKAVYCPMIDARRMEVYDAFYNIAGIESRKVEATIVNENTYAATLQQNRVIFGGNGAAKCEETIGGENTVFLENFEASATFLAPIAERKYQEKDFVDVAYFEPFYLKAFVAGKPKVKGLYQ